MGGKRSGISRKPKTLARRYSDGQLDRADRRARGVRVVLEGAGQIIEDRAADGTASFLLRRTAHRTMHLDQLLAQDELKLAQGQPIDRAAYIGAAQTWLRYALAIGLGRVARRVPSVREYLESLKTSPSTPSASSDSPSAAPAASTVEAP